MIYLVTAQSELVSNELYKIITVKESLELLDSLSVVGLDTETSGLDCFSKQLKSIQLGCYDFQVVIDCLTINPLLYKEYLESDRLFIGWNLKFDLKFLFRLGIIPNKVWDGFLAEKLMWLGYPAGTHGMSLKAAGINYLGIELDKSVRGKIINSGLTSDVIEYAANDVKYLEQIMNKQKEEIAKKDLDNAIKMENAFVFPLAYCEYCGIKLDVDKWKTKMRKDLDRMNEALSKCNKWVEDYFEKYRGNSDKCIEKTLLINENSIKNYSTIEYPFSYQIIGKPFQDPNDFRIYAKVEIPFPFITINYQGDLFEGFSTGPKCSINWNSAKQVINLFKILEINVTTFDKSTKADKDSVDAKILKPQKDKCSLIPLYLEYREAVKCTSTYGENFLKQVNPVSRRIHTNYQQMGADTTRITSGGKDKEGHIEYVNLLNLPADAETRACFVAEKGNKWISIDYSGQETYLMASIANDKAMIKELTYGSGDIHSLTAYMSYKEIPRDTLITEIKSKYHNLRQEAKGIEFAVNYGGDANTISKNKGIPLKEAQEIYDNYMSGFKGLKKYQDFRRNDWTEKGYILLNEYTKHKAYIYDYEQLKEDYIWMQEDLDWDYYGELKRSCPSSETVQRVAHFAKRRSASDKQSVNYPIQASGSMCLRLSLIKFFKYLKENNLLFKVKICVTPYDEINCEAPEEIAEEIASILYKCMVDAGAFFCRRCKLDADISRLPDGSLPTYWIH